MSPTSSPHALIHYEATLIPYEGTLIFRPFKNPVFLHKNRTPMRQPSSHMR